MEYLKPIWYISQHRQRKNLSWNIEAITRDDGGYLIPSYLWEFDNCILSKLNLDGISNLALCIGNLIERSWQTERQKEWLSENAKQSIKIELSNEVKNNKSKHQVKINQFKMDFKTLEISEEKKIIQQVTSLIILRNSKKNHRVTSVQESNIKLKR